MDEQKNIRSAQEIVNALTVNEDGFIHIKPDTLQLLFEKFHSQFNVSDEEIDDREKLVNPYNPNMFKVGFQQGYRKGAQWMRDKIFNKK